MQSEHLIASKHGLSIKASLVIALIALFLSYLGYSAWRDALQVRRDKMAFVSESAKVTGQIVSHDLYTDTPARRKSYYKPVVAYPVAGNTLMVTAQIGTDLKGR